MQGKTPYIQGYNRDARDTRDMKVDIILSNKQRWRTNKQTEQTKVENLWTLRHLKTIRQSGFRGRAGCHGLGTPWDMEKMKEIYIKENLNTSNRIQYLFNYSQNRQ